MENLLFWTQDNKNYCEFEIDKEIAKKYNLKKGDNLNLEEFYNKLKQDFKMQKI